MKRGIRHALYLALGSLALACGGGGTDVAGGGIGGTGVSSGPINGFGSIFVAGTEWDTGSAAVSVDGEPGFSENHLKLGLVTIVRGQKSEDGATGTAATITVDNSVKGKISDAPSTRPDGAVAFEVLGQSLVADGHTAFSPGFSLELLSTALDQWVEVSGLLGVDGTIRATRVESIDPSPEDVKVEGVVSGLNSSSGDFSLALPGASTGLMVLQRGSSTADCMGMTDFAGGAISNGMLVEVEGELLEDGRVCATSVEIEDDLGDADDCEIEGVVTEVMDSTHFNLSRTAVITNASTVYEPASLKGAIEPGMELEAEGSLVDGILMAAKVEREAGVEIEARVDALVGANDFRVLGIVRIHVIPGEAAGFEPMAGDFVEVKALDNGVGDLTAVEVKEIVEPDRSLIKGRVREIAPASAEESERRFVIGGFEVRVDLSVGGTVCENAEEVDISCALFFSDLELGDVVKASDRNSPFDFLDFADEVSLED